MLIRLTVKPNSRTDQFLVAADGSISVKIMAPATEGKANRYLMDYLSEIFSVSKAYIQLVKGERNSNKVFLINAPEAQICTVLEKHLG